MLTTILNDLTGAVTGAVMGTAPITLGIMAVTVIAFGLLAENVGQVTGRAMQALIALGLLIFVVYGLLDPERLTAGAWSARLGDSWASGMALTLLELIGFYVVALIGVAVIFAVRSVVRR